MIENLIMKNDSRLLQKCAFFIGVVLLTGPLTAYAYVGPGAGLTMMGALWAVIAAILFALIGVVLWPIRALIARNKKDSGDGEETSNEEVVVEQASIKDPADSADAK
jgi:hypothetical protein